MLVMVASWRPKPLAIPARRRPNIDPLSSSCRLAAYEFQRCSCIMKPPSPHVPIRCSGEPVSIWTTSRTIFAAWPLSLEPRAAGVGRRGPSPKPATPAGYLTFLFGHAGPGTGETLRRRGSVAQPIGAPMPTPTPPYQFIVIARSRGGSRSRLSARPMEKR